MQNWYRGFIVLVQRSSQGGFAASRGPTDSYHHRSNALCAFADQHIQMAFQNTKAHLHVLSCVAEFPIVPSIIPSIIPSPAFFTNRSQMICCLTFFQKWNFKDF